ncbi:hypothetical protein LWI28_027551 [Acer negundo]|uniref:RNase H type-1 domain-containing protein n=1 Tax=Acer negundo TaxID=4023 RepID=A0AAD5IKU3_ACENE|nr:hypothetical protein LWI28_027551 [Acer negundo]
MSDASIAPLADGKKILIESDSREAVSWMNDEDFSNLSLVNTIYDIRCLLRHLGNTSVHYISRDSNAAADRLAKRGSATYKWGIY